MWMAQAVITCLLIPEGLDTDVVYPNGISTSLPADVQEDFIHTMKGLEKVEILPEESDEICEVCGRRMVIKQGKYPGDLKPLPPKSRILGLLGYSKEQPGLFGLKKARNQD